MTVQDALPSRGHRLVDIYLTHLFGTSWEISAHRSSGVGSMCMSPGTVSPVLHYLGLMRTTFFIMFLAFGWDLEKNIARITS
mgnify:CR=1 FL=1